MAKIGADTDLTQAIRDGISDALEEKIKNGNTGVTIDGNNTSSADNLYHMFQQQNNGYPLLNSYDEAVLTQLLKDTKLLISGYKYATVEENVAAYCSDHRWVPCAVKDPNGVIIKNGQRYSIVLVTRKIGESETNKQNSEFVYYRGNYYYRIHPHTGQITSSTSVSYTHLDVYKRQLMRCAPRSTVSTEGSCSTPSIRVVSMPASFR